MSNKYASATMGPIDIPLRAKRDLTPLILADPEFVGVSTEDLLSLSRAKHVYTTDRASAIAVLKGVVRRVQ